MIQTTLLEFNHDFLLLYIDLSQMKNMIKIHEFSLKTHTYLVKQPFITPKTKTLINFLKQ